MFCNFNFWNTIFTKIMPNFWLTVFTKYVQWFLLIKVSGQNLKSVNFSFTLAVHSPKLWQAKTHFLSHFLGKKGEKIRLGRDAHPWSVDQKLIVLTITPLVLCRKIIKSIYVTYILHCDETKSKSWPAKVLVSVLPE